MTAAAPGYNEFSVKRIGNLLTKVPGINQVKFQPGREHSVVVYLEGPPEVLAFIQKASRKLMADEADIVANGELRLWWD